MYFIITLNHCQPFNKIKSYYATYSIAKQLKELGTAALTPLHSEEKNKKKLI
jgi:hypothetical protein